MILLEAVRSKLLSILALLSLVLIFSGCAIGTLTSSSSSSSVSVAAPNVSSKDLTLITEPEAGTGVFDRLVDKAHISVDVVIYELNDQKFEQALVNAAHRGIKVRVLLNDGYYTEQGFPQNEKSFEFLKANNIEVKPTPSYFALTHQKTLIIDNRLAAIMTLNLTEQYYATGRDFAVLDKNSQDVQAIEQAFSNDWSDQKIPASTGSGDLVWSPGSRPTMLSLIVGAKKTLLIENEEMADKKVISALVGAAQRGVQIKIIMTYSSEWKKAFQELTAAGASIRTYSSSADLYIHAKIIIADNKEAFLGSENFSSTSLSRNRELGIVFSSPSLISSLDHTLDSDYQAARAYNG
jgi:cardiolipin synthase A/B